MMISLDERRYHHRPGTDRISKKRLEVSDSDLTSGNALAAAFGGQMSRSPASRSLVLGRILQLQFDAADCLANWKLSPPPPPENSARCMVTARIICNGEPLTFSSMNRRLECIFALEFSYCCLIETEATTEPPLPSGRLLRLLLQGNGAPQTDCQCTAAS